MKIVLVTSSFEDVSFITASYEKETGIKTTDSSHYPLGIAYLHSYLESQGIDVQSLFLNNYDFHSCFEIAMNTIKDWSPDIVGFQIMTPNRVSSYRLFESIHEAYPHIKIIVGGIHVSIMYQQLIEKYPFLIAVLGEGEITFSELAKELLRDTPNLVNVDGIAFWHNNTVMKTKERTLIEDLDILPFPKHDLYFTDTRTDGCLITTRGCPFKCSFCSLDSISRRRVRHRSVNNVVDEIEYMIRLFPQMKRIWIHDDAFFINNERVIKLCDEIVRRNIQIEFICSGRMKPVSQKLVKKLEHAHFTKVLLGLESGADSVLRRAHKEITQDDVINAFKLFKNSSIDVYAFLIVGLPGESDETVRETVHFVKELQKIKYIHYHDDIAVLAVYPGTEVYAIMKAKGVIEDRYWLTDQPTPLFTVENSQNRLFAYKEFMLNHISLDRLFTWQGIRAQCTMIPFIVKYIFSSKRKMKYFLSQFAQAIIPQAMYKSLRNNMIKKFSKV